MPNLPSLGSTQTLEGMEVDASTLTPRKAGAEGLKGRRNYSDKPIVAGRVQAGGKATSDIGGLQTARPLNDGKGTSDIGALQPQQPNTARPPRSGRSSRAKTPRVKPVTNAAMTPAEAIRWCNSNGGTQLTNFEQSEILEYQNIYFCGSTQNKVQGIPHTVNNNGYDDDRGDYKLVVGDHLEYRYQILGMLGRGSFGQVVRVKDHKKDCIVALKVIRNKKRFHHQALVEVKILEHLMNKDKEHKSNIVRVYGYFYFRNHLCITFEALSMNLYEFIKVNNFKGFSLGLIRRFAIQLLHALILLQKEKIIHCDLKPENVLLKSPNKATIKLIDFGSSCFEDERIYTYIQSRFYRSPEVILGLKYDTSIDMWSFGCILSELYTGYPLFPGENEAEQIQCIMEILGPPPKRVVQNCTRKKTFFDSNMKPLEVPNSRGKIRIPGGSDLVKATGSKDAVFISFLKKCLRWDPKVRLTPERALEHPWITEVTKAAEGADPGATQAKKSTARGTDPKGAGLLLPNIASSGKDKKKKNSLSMSQRLYQ